MKLENHKYTDAELSFRRRAFWGSVVGGFMALGMAAGSSGVVAPWFYIGAGSLFMLAVQQAWPWLNGEVASETMSRRGSFFDG